VKPSLSQINKPRGHLSPRPGTTQRPTWVSSLPALRSQASPPSGQLGVLFGGLSLFLYHVIKELEISHFVKLPFLPPQSLPCHFPREQRSSMINSPRPSGILAFGCPSHYFWKKKNKKNPSLYWATDDLQCCDSFRWTVKGFSLMYPFSPKLPTSVQAATQHWTEFLVLYSKSLLVIHFKYSNVYVSIPNSQTIPLLLLPTPHPPP